MNNRRIRSVEKLVPICFLIRGQSVFRDRFAISDRIDLRLNRMHACGMGLTRWVIISTSPLGDLCINCMHELAFGV